MTPLYAFDLSSKYKLFTHEVKAKKDPVSGDLLIPAYATNQPIIAEKDGYARGFVDGQWQYFIDQRGTEYWDAEGIKYIITEVNVDVPEGALLTAPFVDSSVESSQAQSATTDAELAAQARTQRNALLTETDYIMLADYVFPDHVFPDNVFPDSSSSSKTAWTDYRQGLRNISAQAGFPNDIQWPVRPDAEVIEEGLIADEPVVKVAMEEAQIEEVQVEEVQIEEVQIEEVQIEEVQVAAAPEEETPVVVTSLEKNSEISREPASNDVTTAMIAAVTQAVLQAVNGQAVNSQSINSQAVNEASQEGQS